MGSTATSLISIFSTSILLSSSKPSFSSQISIVLKFILFLSSPASRFFRIICFFPQRPLIFDIKNAWWDRRHVDCWFPLCTILPQVMSHILDIWTNGEDFLQWCNTENWTYYCRIDPKIIRLIVAATSIYREDLFRTKSKHGMKTWKTNLPAPASQPQQRP